MWEIFIDFKVNFAAENSNKFQKTRFWKEKSVEDIHGNTWANGTGHTIKFIIITCVILRFGGGLIVNLCFTHCYFLMDV
jgi:hypothetical protein